MTMKSSLVALLLLSIVVVGCHTDPDLSAVPEISFSGDVQLILGSNCTMSGCHDDGHSSSGGDDDEARSLTTYDDVMNYGDIVAGNSHRSKLYRCITNRDRLMPPSGPMATQDIQKIYLWIEQGAKNN